MNGLCFEEVTQMKPWHTRGVVGDSRGGLRVGVDGDAERIG